MEEAYGAAIERIKAQGRDKSRLGMAALMWISHAERPLRTEELCHALAVELGSTDFNSDNAPSISTVIGFCQGLITVDKAGSTARLIHFTLQEYLSIRHDIFNRPHSTIAEICLTYLNSQQVEAISAHPDARTRVTYFLEYCSLYWGVHAKRELSDGARSLALTLFEEYGLYDGHISLKLLLVKHLHVNFGDFGDSGYLQCGFPFSALHCASLFGIGDLVTALIKTKFYNINRVGFCGYTPLVWAASNGHEEVVKILLEHEGINPDQPDDFGTTPLSHAAEEGHEGVVKILLGQEEVNPDKLDEFEKTPLLYAASGGHGGVVRILLGREEVDPDRRGRCGQTPLSYAAEYGHGGVVKILLGRGEVNPCKPDDAGRTPAAYAVQGGNKGVIKILLACEGVDPDKPETWGTASVVHEPARLEGPLDSRTRAQASPRLEGSSQARAAKCFKSRVGTIPQHSVIIIENNQQLYIET